MMKGIKEKVIDSAIRHYLIEDSSDVQIAYERAFHKKAVELSMLFKEHYPIISSLSNEEIVRVFRYFMGKAAETCIADELYCSDEKRICNISYLFNDVNKEYFGINIPAHYMFELSDLSMHYLMPLKESIEQMRSESDFLKYITSSIMYWQIIAYSNAHLRKAYKAHGHYDNKSIKTLDEIRICAFKGVLQNLTSNGWEIEKMNYLLSNPWNVIGRFKGNDCAMLLRTNFGFFKAGVTIEELEKLVAFTKESKDKDYSVGYLLVNIDSANEQHKEDHVIITGDKMKLEILDLQLYSKNQEQKNMENYDNKVI